MKVALEVWSSDFDRVEETCRLADSLGIHGFYYGESPHELNLDCWTTLAALARSTERIRLGPVITNVLPTYRSTVLLAKQAATVDVISGGRVDFRTGAGASVPFGRPWWEPFGIRYPHYAERLADLERTLAELRSIWGCRTPAVTVAATGDRAMGLAADLADTWESSFCTPEEYATLRGRFDDLVGGRAVTRSLEIDGFLAPTRADADRLLDRVRLDRSAEDLAPVIERALTGPPAEAAAQLRALADVGVDQVVVALHDPLDVAAIEALAEAVSLLETD